MAGTAGFRVQAAAPYVDAHALDIYAFTPGVHFTQELYHAGGGLPFIVAEFSFQSRQSDVKHPAHQGKALVSWRSGPRVYCSIIPSY